MKCGNSRPPALQLQLRFGSWVCRAPVALFYGGEQRRGGVGEAIDEGSNLVGGVTLGDLVHRSADRFERGLDVFLAVAGHFDDDLPAVGGLASASDQAPLLEPVDHAGGRRRGWRVAGGERCREDDADPNLGDTSGPRRRRGPRRRGGRGDSPGA
jgi:hypothetical protein